VLRRATLLTAAAVAALAAPLSAQTDGALAGRVRDAATGRPVEAARVALVGTGLATETDSAGEFRIAPVRAGTHVIEVRAVGYAMARFRNVTVRAGETYTLDVPLSSVTVVVDSVVVRTAPDPVLDPLATETVQRITADDIRRLPVTSIDEALALSAGAVGESYRGGRLGEESFVLDGLGVKNRVDASTGTLGLRVPPDFLTEAALVTDGFSARYGQALSGMVNVVTRDGGDRWRGRASFESDRPLPRSIDMGFDRIVASADGPLPGGVRLVAVLDATGRLDADPVNAPAPPDALDRRAGNPRMLPHNAGEQIDAGAKITAPLGRRATLRLFGLHSLDQRQLFDPAYTYDDVYAPVQRTAGDLVTAHLQLLLGRATPGAFTVDLRAGWYGRDFVRGQLDGSARQGFGAFTTSRYRVVGEAIARAQDTAAARAVLPGFNLPYFASNTPWGVPAFFMTGGSRGDLAWNGYQELRGQLDATVSPGANTELAFGGEVERQRVRTFQRVFAYAPVGGDVPPATAAAFDPLAAAAYVETRLRAKDIAVTAGLRYDQFDARADLGSRRSQSRRALSPRFGVSTVLKGATVVASWGRFVQAPDYQYLVDAAFDDTLRTGRFRVGNPDLGFESSWQYQFSVRARPTTVTSLRVNVFYKRLEGLVASVPFGLNPDSTIFGNTDYGTVKGVELLAEREFHDGWGLRVSYTLQSAVATATDAFELIRRIKVLPDSSGTEYPGSLEIPLDYDRRHGLTAVAQGQVPAGWGPRIAGARPLAGIEAAAIVHYASGLPYSRVDTTGDSLVGLPNSYRLPSQSTVDLLVRRPLRIGAFTGSVYADVRNLLNTRNLIAVRRDTGNPGLTDSQVQSLARAAYLAHPDAIPYESPRYRSWADLNHDGYVSGETELMPLFLGAARDVSQPLFAYGPPRLVRLGVEFDF
jgi:Carboxypeptidase regulatory-like domain/Outer membrane protein beta-barrel family